MIPAKVRFKSQGWVKFRLNSKLIIVTRCTFEIMIIRPILPEDNTVVKNIIQQTILEYGAPKEGTAYSDKATQSMYEHFQLPRRVYYVIELDDEIVGCGGVGPLDNQEQNICELQKMYFLPEARGKGYGKELIQLCIKTAKELAYSKMYLETMDNMFEAQGLYKHMGFKLLNEPIGNTGHYSCPVQMILDL